MSGRKRPPARRRRPAAKRPSATKRTTTQRTSATKRPATKRTSTKRIAAKRASTKRPSAAKRNSTQRTTTQRTTTQRTTTQRTAPRRAASPGARGGLRLVRPRARRAPAKPVPSAFPQIEGGTAKQQLLFALVRARTTLMAALQGLGPGASEQPLTPGGWSVREHVLHLVARDRARLREFETALFGRRASWMGLDDKAMAPLNEAELQPLRHLGWEDALRTLHLTRLHLMEAIEAVPEEPGEVWSEAHPFGAMLAALPPHDRHHAERIKGWRNARS